MKKVILALLISQTIFSLNIGLLTVATGKYINFAPQLIKSARKFFGGNNSVTHFIFTDQDLDISHYPWVRVAFQKKLDWPFSTMMRFHTYYNNRKILKDMDYFFACDVDMLFADYVGDEILSDRVGTIHSGFIYNYGTYDKNPNSKAYIKDDNGIYFAGGFYGGNQDEFLKICKTCKENIDFDLQKNYIAVWHDESHLNRYFRDNPPTKVLSPEYCSPDKKNINAAFSLIFKKKLI